MEWPVWKQLKCKGSKYKILKLGGQNENTPKVKESKINFSQIKLQAKYQIRSLTS